MADLKSIDVADYVKRLNEERNRIVEWLTREASLLEKDLAEAARALPIGATPVADLIQRSTVAAVQEFTVESNRNVPVRLDEYQQLHTSENSQIPIRLNGRPELKPGKYRVLLIILPVES